MSIKVNNAARIRGRARLDELAALHYARVEGYAEMLTKAYLAKILKADGVPVSVIQEYINGYDRGYKEGKAEGELKGKVEERTENIKQMYKKGFSLKIIAKAMRLSKKAVEVYLKPSTESKSKSEHEPKSKSKG